MAEVVIEGLRPIRESYSKLILEQDYLHKILEESTESAQKIATATYAEAKAKMGLV